MVSDAFTRLPLSTEQILHSEKYFKYERPTKILLPDVTNLLNAGSAGILPAPARAKFRRRLPTAHRPLPTSTWHRIDSDVNGEWTYYLILDQFLNAPVESKRAAAGWGGDRYALYEGPNGQVFLAQVAVWDTENDAREFFDAYVKRTELRYPGATPLPSSVSTVPKASEASRAWQTSEGEVVIELRGARVLIVEGVPEGVDATVLLKALW